MSAFNSYRLFFVKLTAQFFGLSGTSSGSYHRAYQLFTEKALARSHFSLRMEKENIWTTQTRGGLRKRVPRVISQGMMFAITRYRRKHDQVPKARQNSHTISKHIINAVTQPSPFPPDRYCQLSRAHTRVRLESYYKHVWQIQENSFIRREQSHRNCQTDYLYVKRAPKIRAV